MRGQIRRAGDQALLVCPADPDELLDMVRLLREAELSAIADLLPAAETVLVTLRPGIAAKTVEAEIRRTLARPPAARAAADHDGRDGHHDEEEVVIPVRYDGEDLADVAGLLGTTADEVVAEHTSRTWRCRFIGFTAGFGYLESDRPGLVLPRRVQSRTAVPAGAVALADGYSAVYPRRAPGGWQLIGTTELAMFDLGRTPPALLRPGTRVRFVREEA